ncbi:TolC family protein [Pseudomonas fluorescens]|nr:TolC family protein [Pseudomonas fluorescens]
MINRTSLMTLALLSALAGCSSPMQEGSPTAGDQMHGQDLAPSLATQLPRWWEGFNDPALNSLMESALRNNQDLASAVERVREVRAQRRLAAAQRYPDIGLAANYDRSRTALNGTNEDYFYGMDLSWEVDLFGRLKALRNEADSQLKASQQDYLSLRISLMAEVANNYLQYRLARRVEQIASEASTAQKQTADVTRARLEQGTSNRLDLERIESQVAVTLAEVPVARQQAETARYNLAYLLASEQSVVDRLLAGEDTAAVPPSPSALSLSSVPVEVLRERPDVRAAEQRLQAAGEFLAAEKAARYPQLTLGLLSGFEQGAGASTWALSTQLFQPLFDFGRISSRIEAGDARHEQARLAYKSSLLQALREVHTAFQAYNQGVERQGNLDQATAAAVRAVDLAKQQYAAGTVSMLEVLDAERSLFDVQRSQVQARADVALRWVEINRTLGIAPPGPAIATL